MADIIVVLIVIVLLGFALRGESNILKVTVPAVAAEPASLKPMIKN